MMTKISPASMVKLASNTPIVQSVLARISCLLAPSWTSLSAASSPNSFTSRSVSILASSMRSLMSALEAERKAREDSEQRAREQEPDAQQAQPVAGAGQRENYEEQHSGDC